MSTNSHKISKLDFLKKSLALSAGFSFIPLNGICSLLYDEQPAQYRKLAMFQEDKAGFTRCGICPNGCVLGEGEVSRCRSRKVYKSKLYTLAYGNPCAAAIDPVEKKPLYHFLPGSRAYSIATAGCNLSCLNCQNWQISQSSPDKTRNFDMPPSRVVSEAIKSKCASIAYTYSEPTTFFEYVYDTAAIARKEGVKNIIKSNGYINPEPLKKLCTVVDAANIDLKSFNDATYRKLSGGSLQYVLDSLRIYLDSGVWLEITCLIIPSWTDKPDEIRAMCKWLVSNGFSQTPIHFNRFYPLHRLEQLPPTPVATLMEAYRIASDEGMKHVYVGNVPGSDVTKTICPGCGTLLVNRSGYRIVSNTLKDGNCTACGKKVEGVWV